MDEKIIELLKTVDKKFQLMPSFVGSHYAKEAKDSGLVEDFQLENGEVWQRLTAEGIQARSDVV